MKSEKIPALESMSERASQREQVLRGLRRCESLLERVYEAAAVGYPANAEMARRYAERMLVPVPVAAGSRGDVWRGGKFFPGEPLSAPDHVDGQLLPGNLPASVGANQCYA